MGLINNPRLLEIIKGYQLPDHFIKAISNETHDHNQNVKNDRQVTRPAWRLEKELSRTI